MALPATERSTIVRKNTAKTQKTPRQGETVGKRTPSASGREQKSDPEATEEDDEDLEEEDEDEDEEDDDR